MHSFAVTILSCFLTLTTVGIVSAEEPFETDSNWAEIIRLVESDEYEDHLKAAKQIQGQPGAADELLLVLLNANQALYRTLINDALVRADGERIMQLFADANPSGKIVVAPFLVQRTLEADELSAQMKIDAKASQEILWRAFVAADDPATCANVINAWWKVADQSREFTETEFNVLAEMLTDTRPTSEPRRAMPPTVHDEALNVLTRCAESNLPAIVKLLDGENEWQRVAAIQIMETRREGPFFEKPIAEKILKLTEDESHLVQFSAIRSLRSMPVEDRDRVVKLCCEFIKDERLEAAAGPVLRDMAELLTPENLKTAAYSCADAAGDSVYAAMALKAMMPRVTEDDAKILVHRILPSMNSTSHHGTTVRSAVVAAGPAALEALPKLCEEFEKADVGKRLRLARGLWNVERNTAKVMPLFLAAVEEKSSTKRYYGFNGLRALGPEAAPATARMSEFIESDNRIIVRQAARVLGTIGPAAKSALPVLKKRLASDDEIAKDEFVQRNIEQAITAIEAE